MSDPKTDDVSPTPPTADAEAQPSAEAEVAHGELLSGPDGGPAERPERQESVEEPAKVMRIGAMIKQLLEEVRGVTLDEPARDRLREIHERSVTELGSALSPDLRDELARVSFPFGDGETPSEGELRIAQAQLVGWLEGLFHGIQATLMAQQMATRAQLEDMRRQLPPGAPGAQGPGPGQPGAPADGDRPGTYL
jgi:hypothetical protein